MAISWTSKVCHLLCGLALTISLTGCGAPEVEIEDKSSNEAYKVSGKDQLKARLLEIAASGIGGSAVSGIQDALNELKQTDAGLAGQLLSDLERLEKLEDANEIKALASQMANKIK